VESSDGAPYHLRMPPENEDPHAGHTTEQIEALERAHTSIDAAMDALGADVLEDFANEDIAEVWRHLRTAHLWLKDVLDAEDHAPSELPETGPGDRPEPIH